MGDGLIVAVPQFLAVPNRYPITQESVSQIIAQCVCFYGFGGGWWFICRLRQAVVQRVFRQHPVKILTGKIFIKEGKGRIVKPYCLRAKSDDFILLCAKVDGIPQGQPVLLGRFRRRIQFIIGGFQRSSQRSL